MLEALFKNGFLRDEIGDRDARQLDGAFRVLPCQPVELVGDDDGQAENGRFDGDGAAGGDARRAFAQPFTGVPRAEFQFRNVLSRKLFGDDSLRHADGLRVAHGGVETQGGILLFENLRGAEEVRQEARDFRPTGARQEDDEIRIAVFRLACVGGQCLQQRMADEFSPHGRFGIDFRLEGEDAEHPADAGGDLRDAARLPCPDLRADVVDDGNADLVEPLREADVEARIVDHDDGVRPFGGGACGQILHQIEEEADMAEDLHDSDDAQIRGVDHDVDSGGAHLVGTHAADGDVRAAFGDGACKPRSVVVSGGFA